MELTYDITGQTFGRLTVIRYEKEHGYKWLCKCSCGSVVHAPSVALRNGRTKSCGCLNRENIRKPSKKFIDISGQRFGRLTAVRYTNGMWECACDCGGRGAHTVSALKKGRVVSCGCYNREVARKTGAKNFTTHGMSKSPEYKIWVQMRQRCEKAYNISFNNYGGRGISVCERWSRFENFISDMGPRPSTKHSIDRIDNDGDYEPGNCRWATRDEQAQNTRTTRHFTFKGKTQTLSEWATELGIKRGALVSRIYNGWSIDRAFSTPVRHHVLTRNKRNQ